MSYRSKPRFLAISYGISKARTEFKIICPALSRSRSSSASWCSTVCTTEHPSTSSTSASLYPVSPPDNTFALCQPRSSRRASLSSQQLRSAGFYCGRHCDMELVTRQYERPDHQQRLLQTFTEDVFIFSLLVYIAH